MTEGEKGPDDEAIAAANAAVEAARAALAAAEARRAMAEAMKRVQEAATTAPAAKPGSGVHRVAAPAAGDDEVRPAPKSGGHKLPERPAPKSGAHKLPERAPQDEKSASSGQRRALQGAPDERGASGALRRPPEQPGAKRPSDRAPAARPGPPPAKGGEPVRRPPARPSGGAAAAKPPAAKGRLPGAPAKPAPAPGRKLSASDFGRPVGTGKPPAGAGARPAPRTAAAKTPGAPAARGPAPAGQAPAASKGPDPITASRKRLRRFEDLGWACAAPKDAPGSTQRGASPAGDPAAKAIAVDVGVEGLCVTSFEGRFDRAKDQAQPTMALVIDPHAFRSMERSSLMYGLPALQRWPSERVLRGTDGALLVPSQIGLVSFPADHVLSATLLKVRDERRKQPKELVLTLPTFLPSDRDEAIRAAVAPWKKGAFRGVPGAIAAGYFYLVPALDRTSGEGELPRWSREALAAGRVLLLDWGASGLEYGVVTVKGASGAGASSSAGSGGPQTELRLQASGIWPSLGGHRLTASILTDLKTLLTDRILAAGPSDALLSRALIAHGEKLEGRVPFPIGYEEAFRRLTRLGPGPLPPHEEEERRRLRNVLFPTQWRFGKGEEPPGYAPYRKLAVAHFKALWDEAEKIKRMIFSDPEKYRQRRTIPWNLSTIDSPFCSHLDEAQIPYPVAPFLETVQAGLHACLAHIDRRVTARGIKPTVHVGLKGMQSCSPLLSDGLRAYAATREARALSGAKVCPCSSDPLEQKAITNRGAALLNRDKRAVDFGPLPDVLPFSVEIADCLGNIEVFHAGPIDELSVFQRRFKVEGGAPHLEFYIYQSEDDSHRGTWGAIDFSKPFEFSERDRVFGVDPRYGFGGEVPRLSDLKPELGRELLARFHDRGSGSSEGLINFRAVAPRESEEARRLLHFLEYGLTGEFHRKVYLLEREFPQPPKRFDHVYQRYYLSRSQELIVVREWWSPFEDNKLIRHKTLHTCQGTTTANAILGLEWGRF